MRGAALVIKAVELMRNPQEKHIMPDSLLEVSREWGCTWMRESLRLYDNEDWTKGAIENGSLICVTDGSYIKEMVPDLCSDA